MVADLILLSLVLRPGDTAIAGQIGVTTNPQCSSGTQHVSTASFFLLLFFSFFPGSLVDCFDIQVDNEGDAPDCCGN